MRSRAQKLTRKALPTSRDRGQEKYSACLHELFRCERSTQAETRLQRSPTVSSVSDSCIVEIERDHAKGQPSAKGFGESAVPVEACNCEGEAKEQSRIQLKCRRLPLVMVKDHYACQRVLVRHTVAIGIGPVFTAGLPLQKPLLPRRRQHAAGPAQLLIPGAKHDEPHQKTAGPRIRNSASTPQREACRLEPRQPVSSTSQSMGT